MNRTQMSGLILIAAAGSASAQWDDFVIRDGNSGASPTIQTNNDYVSGATEFIIDEGGMKAAVGTDNVNGDTLGDVSQVAITRHDDTTRFSSGSGPAVAPYFNIWVTNESGDYAVIANEPSNPSFMNNYLTDGPGDGLTYDFALSDISSEPANVYETPGWNSNSTWIHSMLGESGNQLTFDDVLGLTIEAPSDSYINDPSNEVGSGAPDDINTDTAHGFNWVFGDTMNNYTSGEDGYIVSNFAVPAPGSVALLGLGGLAAARRRR